MNWDDIIIDASATDTGMRRQNNQDSHTAVRAPNRETWRQRGHLFMVADGMGAHAVGELASKMACDLVPHGYMKAKTGTAGEAVTKALRDVSRLIHGRAAANRDFQGMGTTCSVLLLLPEGALLGHVGDSRIYRVREGRIDQLTFDHSLVWELIRRNHLTADQAKTSIPKNVITRSLGPEADIEVDLEGPLVVRPGDVFLLCSDGLSGPVTDPELGAFAENFHPRDACRYLLQLANLRGGLDNITVQIVRIGPWVDPDSGEADNQDPSRKSKGDANGRVRGSWKERLLDRFTGPKPLQAIAPDEENHYRSCECAIDEKLIRTLLKLVEGTREAAISQAWPIDWTALSTHRKQLIRAREANNARQTLREIGELICLLGAAGRFHHKSPVS